MAERIADNADLAVDELKRRARRRLVGAIVLALAAAVILPLLLEKEPKPLGDDVSVQIPPVDEGRFINRLTGRESKSGSKFDGKALPKAPPSKLDAALLIAPAPAPVTTTPAAPVAETTPAASTPSASAAIKSVTESEQRVLSPAAKPAAKVEAKTASEQKADARPSLPVSPTVAAAAPAESAAAMAPAPTKGEGFAVQIAAFTDDKGANALGGKLKRAGYATTYTEPVETSRGTLWRVRVGGFATRADAETARAKLKTEGWNGLVVAAK